MLPFHILSFGFVIGVTALADKEAFDWVLGKKRTLDAALIRRYHFFVWLGLLFLSVTGVALFFPLKDELLTNSVFLLKMLLVGVLVVNGILIGRLQHAASVQSFSELHLRQKIELFASGVISTASWLGAGVLAFFLF